MFKNFVDAPNPNASYAETLAFNMYAEEISRKEKDEEYLYNPSLDTSEDFIIDDFLV